MDDPDRHQPYRHPNEPDTSRPEMVVVFLFFTGWGFLLGLLTGWLTWA